jgi:hypothetical protein
MFFKLFAMLGWIDKGHKQAAGAARERFGAAQPGVKIEWTEIVEEEPARFIVGVYYGSRRPKQRQLYSVDRETFKAIEIPDPRESGNGHRKS